MSDQNESVDEWPLKLKAEFNRFVEEAEYGAWVSTLERKIGTVDDSELCEAIALASEHNWTPKHTNDKPVVAKNVIQWVWRLREREKRRKAKLDLKVERQNLRAKIDATDDPDEIWEMIIVSDCSETRDWLEKYALSKGFHRDQVSKAARATKLLADLEALQKENGTGNILRNVKHLIKPTKEELK